MLLANRRLAKIPLATDDIKHEALSEDPTIPQFIQSQTQVDVNQSSLNVNISETNSLVKADTHWVNRHWRPMMGWSYLIICLFDFLVAPILWSLFQLSGHGNIAAAWQPLTLQGAGLYHLAMGTIMGITSYGRTKEKLAGLM